MDTDAILTKAVLMIEGSVVRLNVCGEPGVIVAAYCTKRLDIQAEARTVGDALDALAREVFDTFSAIREEMI